MKRKKTSPKKYPKLRGSARSLASKFIAEETRSGLPRKQAIAVGISRARARASQKKAKPDKIVAKYL